LTGHYYRGKCIDIFRVSIRSKSTLDPYERRLLYFLKEFKQTPDAFVKLARSNPKAAEKNIVAFVSKERACVDVGEITPATMGNCLKAIRLLLEMNEASSSINWKKIKRLLPPARRYALDRVPTEQELRKIV
jgi:hypothetical protein